MSLSTAAFAITDNISANSSTSRFVAGTTAYDRIRPTFGFLIKNPSTRLHNHSTIRTSPVASTTPPPVQRIHRPAPLLRRLRPLVHHRNRQPHPLRDLLRVMRLEHLPQKLM